MNDNPKSNNLLDSNVINKIFSCEVFFCFLRKYMTEPVVGKKRGRKRKDCVDACIEQTRLDIPRGINFLQEVMEEDDLVHDNLIQVILAQELDLVKDGQLLEFRETEGGDEAIAGGSPVAVRMNFPPLSVYKSLKAALDQILYTQMSNRTAMHAFTHESHILLSKACELITIEAVSRAFLHASDRSAPSRLDDTHLKSAMRRAWKSEGKNISGNMSFDFLEDTLRPVSASDDPIDLIAKIHSRT